MSVNCNSIISASPLHFQLDEGNKNQQEVKPEQVFRAFADMPWAMWLDSGQSNHSDSQFDIMVWQPAITVVTEKGLTRVTNSTENTVQTIETVVKDPLSVVDQYQQQLFSSFEIKVDNTIPFLGGTLGYFSYDLGRYFEQLPNKAQRDIELPEMAVGLYLQAIIYNRKSKQFTLVCPQNERKSIEQEILARVGDAPKSSTFTLTSDWQMQISQQEYTDKFTAIQEYLKAGDCYQINLTQRFSGQYQGDEYTAYLALREANNAPFSAFIRLPKAAILSVSPERFIQVQGKQVQTKPIKGTLPRFADANLDAQQKVKLQQSSKDRAENLMIVDLLRNDLSRACKAGTVKVPKLFDVESFPAVHHLVSTITAELADEHNAIDLLRASFPGGSITGAPKIRAMEIIDELEPHRRSIYCGSIGYLSACGNMDTSITIRTLATIDNTIYCWAGGGIVVDSTAENEYQESFDKVNKILPILSQLS